MGGGENKLTGPDLAHGVRVAEIEEGKPLLGHANGEAVLVARVGTEVFAIGASCTHYGGPLAEGLITGGEVRCPWHHACFDLRTGVARRAPALNPVACYAVTIGDGVARVGAKREREPLAPERSAPLPRAASELASVVVIGAGAAGTAAAEMLRRQGYVRGLTIVDEEAASPYDRPNLSKDYLAGTAPEEWIPLRPPGFYEQHDIRVVRARATRIDTAARRVELDGSAPITYDALILATGAEPVRLTMPGGDLPHVRYLRSLADSRAIIDRAKGAKRAVVMGASFIGLEVAASLRNRDVEVHVVAPETVPLERVMGPQLGNFIKALHEEHGVRFHLPQTATGIEADRVILKNGDSLPADLVVIGVGVRPRTSLAESAGLSMDRGVSVNEYLQTSAPNVYAAGDIARWPDPHTGSRIRVEHWVVAERMGQVAACNVLGLNRAFDAVPFFWSAHYDVSINYVGHAESWDRIDVDGDPAKRDVTVKFVKDGRALAVASIFRDQESLQAEVTMERKAAASVR
jgi:apoptosis-inducing factor 3